MCKCEYDDVRVIDYVRVNMECASSSTVMCEWSGHNVRVVRS